MSTGDVNKMEIDVSNKSQNIKNDIRVIDDNVLRLIRYFLRSNSSMEALKDPDLRELLKPKINLPGPFSFRNTVLQSVMDKLKTALEFKLKNAEAFP